MLKIMREISLKINNLWIKLKKLNKMMMIGMELLYLLLVNLIHDQKDKNFKNQA